MKKVLWVLVVVSVFLFFGCMDSSVKTTETPDPFSYLQGKKIEDLSLLSAKATGYATVYGTVKLPDGTYAPNLLASNSLLKSEGAEFVEGEYVVYTEDGNILSKMGITVKRTYNVEEDGKEDKIMVIKASEEQVQMLKKISGVKYVEPNYIYRAYAVPNDTYYEYQWHYEAINLPKAWDIIKSANVVVAVVDTGVSFTHPDLQGIFVQGYDFVDNDTDPTDPAQDVSHGTHVTGTIAALSNNGKGVAGVNWGGYGIKIMPIRVLGADGSGTLDAVAQGVRYAADHGAKIINMSLGGGGDSQILREAIQYAYNKGVTIVCAAGNENGPVSYPAKYPETIAVASVRYDLQRAPYSNYGPEVDVAAPGGDTSVDQNGDGYADGVLSTAWTPNNGDTYMFLQGTSMAAPHVAGVAALLYASGKTTPEEIRAALKNTAKDLGPAGEDDYYGAGLIDAYAALNYRGGGSDPNPEPQPEVNTQIFVLRYDYWTGRYYVVSEMGSVSNGSYTLSSVQPGYYNYVCAWRDYNNNGTIDTGDYFGYKYVYRFSSNNSYRVNLQMSIEQ
ncbi:peptidase S8 [Thermosipho melanesiensis]|uniref:Peptidase S8 and S53, subtilisin, kexin, sedolisin n=2 Tax=Thermosipho melanesiensis TaxID=46541 RepID=A6LLC2_THEM4|nr:S8 family peptidase [Thermosipho melanesiensis]ABR30723.1 peptidase S8 and S53, subtilisin, kexin, sedolisin [Thermosipho melanesiensis BI429]APT73852.1 peptidase S8 [Thermosipho melanesiensis]OOC35792.1 peptidase S8 [Thermosipho melanesiensis]OOC38294.1 peptidase S8 [Thermosipho melanesiensis]OOC38755.1 peptidase S8 [Thermosipho melanesiensis]